MSTRPIRSKRLRTKKPHRHGCGLDREPSDSLNFLQLVLSPLLATTLFGVDRCHLLRCDRGGFVAPLLTDIAQHCGNSIIAPIVARTGHLSERRHGGLTELLALDGEGTFETVK